jgi:hypothetical protein
VFNCTIGCDEKQYARQAPMLLHMEKDNKQKRRRNKNDFMFLRTPPPLPMKDDQDFVAHEK